MRKYLLTALGAIASLLALCGCGSGTPAEATAEQTKAFDGGPMPESAKQRMAQGLANARQGADDAAAKARAQAQGGH